MTSSTPLLDYGAAKAAGMESVARHAGDEFRQRALAFVPEYLRLNGETSGEDLTEAAKCMGIVPHDDRAFGPIYAKLLRDGEIVRTGFCLRKRGHGTSGGSVYRVND